MLNKGFKKYIQFKILLSMFIQNVSDLYATSLNLIKVYLSCLNSRYIRQMQVLILKKRS